MERRRFSVTAPDWGPAHLSSDAVVAFVDDELAHGPQARASAHVSACPECAAEVVAQRQARTALRAASCPALPSSLLSSLRAIPQDTELPAPPAGLAVSADGQLVSVLRAEPEASPAPETGSHGRRPPAARRMRFGAGAAVSGLAIGALTLGVGSLPADSVVPDPDRGVLGGSVLSPGVAQFGFEPGLRTADVEARLTERAGRMPHTFLRLGSH